MIVDRRLRHSALVRVLRAVSSEESLVVHDEDLGREWRRMTGLRQADLESALHEMVDLGHMTVERAAGTRRNYTLTSAGRRDMLWHEALHETADWFVLLGTRVRRLLGPLRHSQRPANDRRQRGGTAAT